MLASEAGINLNKKKGLVELYFNFYSLKPIFEILGIMGVASHLCSHSFHDLSLSYLLYFVAVMPAFVTFGQFILKSLPDHTTSLHFIKIIC